MTHRAAPGSIKPPSWGHLAYYSFIFCHFTHCGCLFANKPSPWMWRAFCLQQICIHKDKQRVGELWNCCCVSIQGLDPLKDSAFVGPSETILTSSAVVKCDGRAFGAFPGCVTRCFSLTSRFLPLRPANVTIYATRRRHFLSFFLLGHVRPRRIEAVHPPETGRRRSVWRSLQEPAFCRMNIRTSHSYQASGWISIAVWVHSYDAAVWRRELRHHSGHLYSSVPILNVTFTFYNDNKGHINVQ